MTCRICSGPLELLYKGSGIEASALAFSPTNHQPGQYGDLYRCERCGYEWLPRRESTREPKVCANPKCKSPYWDRPRLKQKPSSDSRTASVKSCWDAE